jgi:hypothetical protein
MKPEKVAFARRLVGGAAWLLSACYSTVTVAPDEFFGMGKELSGARITNGAGGTPVLVDAQSMVRAHLRQGEVTAWFKAGDLTVTPEGLIVGPGLPASEVSVARVTDLGGEQLQLLKELAPSGGSVGPSRAGEGYQLAASFGETLPWAIRFASQCQGRGLSAGVWHLRRSDSFAGLVDFDGSGSAVVAGRVLAEAPATSSFTLAPGIRRADVLRLEVNFFDPLSSAAAVPLFPFVLVALMLDPEGTEAGMSSASSTWEPRATIWSDSSAARLFTGRARRRAIVQFVAGVEAGASIRGDVAGAASVGVRIRNFYEFAGLARQISFADLDPSGSRDTRTLAGFAMGAHVDSDGDPRFAMTFGLEVAGTRGSTPVTWVSLRWGPRLKLAGPLFLTVSPLNLAHLRVSGRAAGSDYRASRIMSGVEIGGSL